MMMISSLVSYIDAEMPCSAAGYLGYPQDDVHGEDPHPLPQALQLLLVMHAGRALAHLVAQVIYIQAWHKPAIQITQYGSQPGRHYRSTHCGISSAEPTTLALC